MKSNAITTRGYAVLDAQSRMHSAFDTEMEGFLRPLEVKVQSANLIRTACVLHNYLKSKNCE
jgi:hypothetical protein